MPGTQVGSGWTGRASRRLIRERCGACDSKRGGRKLLHRMGWRAQSGRPLSIRRRPEEHARFVLETEDAFAQYAARKEEGSPHHWPETLADLSHAITTDYQTVARHPVTFLETFGYEWSEGSLCALQANTPNLGVFCIQERPMT